MKIVPLSKKNLKEAVALVVRIFNSKPDDFDAPQKWFPASLSPTTKKSKEIYKSYGTTYLKYYLGLEDGKVIGTTGIYLIEEDQTDSAWVAYLCLDPAFRGKGYGAELLDFSMNLARKMGKKYMKLYTTYNLDIKKAMKLYEKRGFKITKIENHRNTNQEMVFMEAKLN